MQLKPMNIKSLINLVTLIFLACFSLNAQVIIDDDDNLIKGEEEERKVFDISEDGKVRQKIDGVAAVVGDYLITESDLMKFQLDAKEQGIPASERTSCRILERMMENKLFAHHAVQDSLEVPEERVMAETEQQISQMVEQVGSLDKIIEFYGQSSEDDLKAKLYEINLERNLAQMMKSKVVDDLEVTPEETRKFFESIPNEDVPIFGDELEVAQIVIQPKVPQEQVDKVIDRLNEMRRDVLENGASFVTKATFYSEDKASRSSGGLYTLTRRDSFVKEFKDAAFSLDEGEISKPFESEFGWHILMVEKIRGQQVDVRHILLYPEVTSEAIKEAKEKADKIKKMLEADELEFKAAAKEFSDEPETRESGGQLINSADGSKRFELAKMDTELYTRVYKLREGELSRVIRDEDRTGKTSFKIYKVTKKIPEHKANFSDDYPKIKELALRQKQLKEVKKWVKDKSKDTYIKFNTEYKVCDFASDWMKEKI